MGLFDAFGYKGKRAAVVGGASGMGSRLVSWPRSRRRHGDGKRPRNGPAGGR